MSAATMDTSIWKSLNGFGLCHCTGCMNTVVKTKVLAVKTKEMHPG